jgi:hypothetical protein
VSAIGVLRERPLHAALKQHVAQPGDHVEMPVDGYVIDLVRGDLLIEIQTRGFSMLKPKLLALLGAGHAVRIVHPIAVDRWLLSVDDDGTLLARRRSPRHGAVADLASELVSFPALLAHPRLEIEVLLTAEEELRRHVPGRCWRRRGWTVLERRLVDVRDSVLFTATGDLLRLLPDGLAEPFTTAELATALRRPRRVAQQVAYCLREAGAIAGVDRQSGAVAYARAGGG